MINPIILFILTTNLINTLASSKKLKFNARIIGGKNTSIEQFPYQVSVQQYGNHHCGGSIISEEWVITAGHCIGQKPKGLTIRAGSTYRDEGGSIHAITKIVRHKNFSINEYNRAMNDIALIQVNKLFQFDKTRRAIQLFDNNDEPIVGTMANISGWGSLWEFRPEPKVLQIASVPIVSKDICHKAYRRIGGIFPGQICAGYYLEGGKNGCLGDSGSPLVINGRLAGVISGSIGCARPEYPEIYTEVAEYRSWIRENTGV